MKLQEVKGRYSLTVPHDLVALARWQKGERLLVMPSGKEGELLIKKILVD